MVVYARSNSDARVFCHCVSGISHEWISKKVSFLSKVFSTLTLCFCSLHYCYLTESRSRADIISLHEVLQELITWSSSVLAFSALCSHRT